SFKPSFEQLEDRRLMTISGFSSLLGDTVQVASTSPTSLYVSESIQAFAQDSAAQQTSPYTDLLQGDVYFQQADQRTSPALAGVLAEAQKALNYVSDQSQGPYGLQDVLTYASSDQEQGRIAIENRVAQLGAARLGAAVDAESFATADGYARI